MEGLLFCPSPLVTLVNFYYSGNLNVYVTCLTRDALQCSSWPYGMLVYREAELFKSNNNPNTLHYEDSSLNLI